MVGYHIDHDPAPIMVVMPTERDAETWSKDRFSPMARDTPCLQGKIADPRSRDGNNKILHKRFPGGHLTIVGANAPSGLASRPIRLLLCDEVDRYPFSAGAEGDPVNLAKKRTVTFWNRKIVLVSTPTNKGASRIEAAFEESDQRRYWVPCPACGAEQLLTWGQVKWDKDENGGHRPETARYHCADCDAAWKDETRWAAISKGRWIADAPFNGTAGFHLNEIYSPWVRLEALVASFKKALFGTKSEKIDPAQYELELEDIETAFATMRSLAMRFSGIMRGRQADPLPAWIDDAIETDLVPIMRFARTLNRDFDAVKNAIEMPWSNGQAEGQINRLKTLKRAMYGRAGPALLRARMLPFRHTD